MRKKYQAVITCGYCNRKIEISDKNCELMLKGEKEIYNMCPCNHISYATTMRCRMEPSKDWRFGYGHS